MKVYGIIVTLLALAGIGLMLLTKQRNQPDDGRAAIVYTENEDGQMVPGSEVRPASGTKIPPRKKDDGSEQKWMGKFVLTERSGKQLGTEELMGQPYVAGFFFSTCPSVCVRQNSKVQELQEQFKGEPIRFLSISCDPEVDNPEVLTEYAKRFDADADQWLFFTGKMDYIRRVGSEVFSLGVMRQGHPEKFALMDANGKLYKLYTWSDDGQWGALQDDIKKMLAAGGVLDS